MSGSRWVLRFASVALAALLLASCSAGDQPVVPDRSAAVAAVPDGPLAAFPAPFLTLNGSQADGIEPALANLKRDGRVYRSRSFDPAETGNAVSVFGVTRNSLGEFWTSSQARLIQFDPKSRKVLRSLPRSGEPFLVIAFAPDDRLIGWSNSNGYLYEIELLEDSYTETQLVFVGQNTGGLTGLAFAADGTLWGVVNRVPRRLVTIDPSTGSLTTLAPLPSGGIGIAFAPDGTIFTTSSLVRSITQFATDGTVLWTGAYDAPTPILGIEFP
jgi:sugar lactone lactonase YvrE